MSSEKIKIEVTGAIFTLPYYVAQDHGYFAEEGLDVELVPAFAGQEHEAPVEELVKNPEQVSSFEHFKLFEGGDSTLYRACEWGQIRRSYDSERAGQVVSKRAAVPSQALVTRPESGLYTVRSLANRPVGVNFHHGSHYMGIQMLEGFLPREAVNIVHVGGPRERLEALQEGRIDAAVLMEPWITISEKLGLLAVAEAHYNGTEIAGPDLSPESFAAINRAVSKAVRTINADIHGHLHYFVRDVPDDLGVTITEDDFKVSRLRFFEPAPYPREEFERTYAWMLSWNLIPADSCFEDLIDNRVGAAAGS